MILKTIPKAIASLSMGVMLAGMLPMTAFASGPTTGANISQQVIPVIASTNSYYIIGTPAGIDGTGNLNLTNEHNGEVHSDGDDANKTFYGYTNVNVQGNVSSDKKIHVDLTCEDLVHASDASKTAAVGIRALTDEEATKAVAIWGGDNTKNIAFGNAEWTPGDPDGLSMDFASTEVLASSTTTRYAMLHTTLPDDGTYTSNLVIDFSLAASGSGSGG